MGNETKSEWLRQIHEHAGTSEMHYAAAEVLVDTAVCPAEHTAAADELAQLGFLIKNPNGTYAAVIPFQ